MATRSRTLLEAVSVEDRCDVAMLCKKINCVGDSFFKGGCGVTTASLVALWGKFDVLSLSTMQRPCCPFEGSLVNKYFGAWGNYGIILKSNALFNWTSTDILGLIQEARMRLNVVDEKSRALDADIVVGVFTQEDTVNVVLSTRSKEIQPKVLVP